MGKNWANLDRKFWFVSESVTYAEAIWTVLDEGYGSQRHGPEMLARTAGVVPRTAKNWLQRKCAPRGDELVRLMAADDRVADTMLDLVLQRREELRLHIKNVRARHAALGCDLSVAPGSGADRDQLGNGECGGSHDGLG